MTQIRTFPIICGILLALAFCSPAIPLLNAQPAGRETLLPLSGPLLNRVPDYTKWVITIKIQKTKSQDLPAGPADLIAAQEALRIRSIVVTKTGPVIREEIFMGEGRKWEKWVFNGTIGVINYGTRLVVTNEQFSNSEDRFHSDFGKSDFDGLNWIGVDNYKGVKKMEGMDCLVFEKTLSDERFREAPQSINPAAPGKPPGEQPGKTIAFISIQSRLPAYLLKDGELRTYTFIALPKVIQPVPAPIADAAGAEQKSLELQLLARPQP